MNITINNEDVQFSGNTLLELLNERDLNKKGNIAIAVNETVIPRNDWFSYKLNENDSILIITPAQGG